MNFYLSHLFHGSAVVVVPISIIIVVFLSLMLSTVIDPTSSVGVVDAAFANWNSYDVYPGTATTNTDLFHHITSIAYEALNDTIYLASYGDRAVVVHAPASTDEGKTLELWGWYSGTDSHGFQNGDRTSAIFKKPYGLAAYYNKRGKFIDGLRGILVSDVENYCLRFISARTNQVVTASGSCENSGNVYGDPTTSRYEAPGKIVISARTGRIAFSEPPKQIVRMLYEHHTSDEDYVYFNSIRWAGQYATAATGDYTETGKALTEARFKHCEGMSFHASGMYLYITSWEQKNIRKMSPAYEVSDNNWVSNCYVGNSVKGTIDVNIYPNPYVDFHVIACKLLSGDGGVLSSETEPGADWVTMGGEEKYSHDWLFGCLFTPQDTLYLVGSDLPDGRVKYVNDVTGGNRYPRRVHMPWTFTDSPTFSRSDTLTSTKTLTLYSRTNTAATKTHSFSETSTDSKSQTLTATKTDSLSETSTDSNSKTLTIPPTATTPLTKSDSVTETGSSTSTITLPATPTRNLTSSTSFTASDSPTPDDTSSASLSENITFSESPSSSLTYSASVTESPTEDRTLSQSVSYTDATFTLNSTESQSDSDLTPTSTVTGTLVSHTKTGTSSKTFSGSGTYVSHTRSTSGSKSQSVSRTMWSLSRTPSCSPSPTESSTVSATMTESNTESDSIQPTASVSVSTTETETIPPTPTRTFSWTRTASSTPSETTTQTESDSLSTSASSTPSETATLTESDSLSTSASSTPSETTTLTESESLSESGMTETRSPSVTHPLTGSKSLSESVTLSESTSPSSSETPSISTSETGTESVSSSLSDTDTPSTSESLTLTESDTHPLTESDSLSETVSLSDSISNTPEPTPSETETVTESTSDSKSESSTLSESTSPSSSETSSHSTSQTETLTDPLTESNSLSWSLTMSESLTEPTPSESISHELTESDTKRTHSLSFTLTETQSETPTETITHELTESLSASHSSSLELRSPPSRYCEAFSSEAADLWWEYASTSMRLGSLFDPKAYSPCCDLVTMSQVRVAGTTAPITEYCYDALGSCLAGFSIPPAGSTPTSYNAMKAVNCKNSGTRVEFRNCMSTFMTCVLESAPGVHNSDTEKCSWSAAVMTGVTTYRGVHTLMKPSTWIMQQCKIFTQHIFGAANCSDVDRTDASMQSYCEALIGEAGSVHREELNNVILDFISTGHPGNLKHGATMRIPSTSVSETRMQCGSFTACIAPQDESLSTSSYGTCTCSTGQQRRIITYGPELALTEIGTNCWSLPVEHDICYARTGATLDTQNVHFFVENVPNLVTPSSSSSSSSSSSGTSGSGGTAAYAAANSDRRANVLSSSQFGVNNETTQQEGGGDFAVLSERERVAFAQATTLEPPTCSEVNPTTTACTCASSAYKRRFVFAKPRPGSNIYYDPQAITYCAEITTNIFLVDQGTGNCLQPLLSGGELIGNFSCKCLSGATSRSFPVAYINETTGEVGSGMLVFCGQPPVIFSVVGAITTTALSLSGLIGGPAMALLQAAVITTLVDCEKTDEEKEEESANRQALFPITIGSGTLSSWLTVFLGMLIFTFVHTIMVVTFAFWRQHKATEEQLLQQQEKELDDAIEKHVSPVTSPTSAAATSAARTKFDTNTINNDDVDASSPTSPCSPLRRRSINPLSKDPNESGSPVIVTETITTTAFPSGEDDENDGEQQQQSPSSPRKNNKNRTPSKVRNNNSRQKKVEVKEQSTSTPMKPSLSPIVVDIPTTPQGKSGTTPFMSPAAVVENGGSSSFYESGDEDDNPNAPRYSKTSMSDVIPTSPSARRRKNNNKNNNKNNKNNNNTISASASPAITFASPQELERSVPQFRDPECGVMTMSPREAGAEVGVVGGEEDGGFAEYDADVNGEGNNNNNITTGDDGEEEGNDESHQKDKQQSASGGGEDHKTITTSLGQVNLPRSGKRFGWSRVQSAVHAKAATIRLMQDVKDEDVTGLEEPEIVEEVYVAIPMPHAGEDWWTSLKYACCMARYPYVSMLFGRLAFQGFAFDTILLIARAGSGADTAVGVFGIILCFAWTVWHMYLGDYIQEHDAWIYKKYSVAFDEFPEWIPRRIFPHGFWHNTPFVLCFRAAVDLYIGTETYLKHLSWALYTRMIVIAIIVGVETPKENCSIVYISLLVVMWASAVLFLFFRPHRRPVDDAINVTLSFLNGLMILFILKPTWNVSPLLIFEVILYCAIGSMFFTFFYAASEFFWWNRLEVRLAEEAEKRRIASKRADRLERMREAREMLADLKRRVAEAEETALKFEEEEIRSRINIRKDEFKSRRKLTLSTEKDQQHDATHSARSKKLVAAAAAAASAIASVQQQQQQEQQPTSPAEQQQEATTAVSGTYGEFAFPRRQQEVSAAASAAAAAVSGSESEGEGLTKKTKRKKHHKKHHRRPHKKEEEGAKSETEKEEAEEEEEEDFDEEEWKAYDNEGLSMDSTAAGSPGVAGSGASSLRAIRRARLAARNRRNANIEEATSIRAQRGEEARANMRVQNNEDMADTFIHRALDVLGFF